MIMMDFSAPPLKENDQTMVLILLGPPGVGKGTQAQKLSKTLELPHISTGDILRANIKEGTPLGKEAKTFMDQGDLVPDALILDMLFDRVANSDCKNGYILDGFPRTIAQAQAYKKRLGTKGTFIALSLYLEEEAIIERLSKRLTCSDCSAPYHLVHSPPIKEGECNQCHGKLIQRTDDQKEVIQKRLSAYHAQTAPLIDYFSKESALKTIDCSSSIEAILEEILDHLQKVHPPLKVGAGAGQS